MAEEKSDPFVGCGYWAHLVRLLPAQGEAREKLSSDHPREPLLRYVALGVIQSRLPQLRADGCLWDFEQHPEPPDGPERLFSGRGCALTSLPVYAYSFDTPRIDWDDGHSCTQRGALMFDPKAGELKGQPP